MCVSVARSSLAACPFSLSTPRIGASSAHDMMQCTRVLIENYFVRHMSRLPSVLLYLPPLSSHATFKLCHYEATPASSRATITARHLPSRASMKPRQHETHHHEATSPRSHATFKPRHHQALPSSSHTLGAGVAPSLVAVQLVAYVTLDAQRLIAAVI